MRVLRVLPLLFPLAVAVAGCPTLPAPVLCGEIPAGGGPVGRGGSCDDLTCAALYDCVDGHWVSAQACDRSDAGSSPDAPDGGDGGLPGDGGACTTPVIDTSNEAKDCTPDLESPDCPAQAAFPCAETACLTGCQDFFVCKPDGWHDVAYCTDDLQLVLISDGPTPP